MWDDLMSNPARVNLALFFLLHYDHLKHEVKFFQQSDLNLYQMSTKTSHTYDMWNHPSNSWWLLFCFVGCTPLQTLQRTDKHTHFAENLTGCRNSSPICKLHNMASHLQPMNKEKIWGDSKFVKRTRREMITIVWQQKKMRQNKDTEKGITVKF